MDAPNDANGSPGGSWAEWRRLVLSQLEDGKRERASIRKEIQNLRNDLTAPKIRVYGISGAIATVGGAGVSIAVNLIVKGLT